MPTPYDLYVRFLVTTGVDDSETINERLESLNLPEAPAEAINAQVALVDSTLPQGIKDQIENQRYGADFLKWMLVLQVEELWHFEKTPFTKDQHRRSVCKLVYDIHQDETIRTTINSLLIKAVPAKDLVQAINQRYASLLRDEHIRLYEKFFFNPKQMTRAAWRQFIERCDGPDKAAYFLALSEPVDIVKTDLQLPSKTATSENLQFLATKAFLRARDAIQLQTPAGSDEARKWIDTYLKVTDKYEKYRSGDMGDFANALQMEFDFVDSEFSQADPEVLREIAERTKLKDEKEEAEGGKPPEGGHPDVA